MAVLKDSGERTAFGSGAVRDMGTGKGMMDKFPLSCLSMQYARKANRAETAEKAKLYEQASQVFMLIDKFLYSLQTDYLYDAIEVFYSMRGWSLETATIEVSKHFEDGAVKYGPHNWTKGIPLSSYINSGCRHMVQWIDEDTTDPHDRAFVWNMLCAIWTVDHRPECIDTPMHKWDCVTPYTGFDFERSSALVSCPDTISSAADCANSYDPSAPACPDGATACTAAIFSTPTTIAETDYPAERI